jgi:hypothetical protein
MGSLLDTLTKKKRRESAGSDTAARFDFQKNWALCEMLRRHGDGIEYLVAFEFHDDVLFFTPESTPDSVEFVQVKTSKSPKARTISSLTNATASGSILAKLATNTKLVAPPIAVRLVLVSNTPFEFSDVGIAGSAIAEPHRAKLIKGLTKEFPGTEEETLQKLHFLIANLPIDEMDTFVKGKAVELFEKRFGINFTQNAMSWLRLIQGEIRRKNNYPDDKITNVKDLLDNKCIGRTLIEETLNDVEKQHRPPPDLSAIRSELQKGGWALPSLIKFDKAVARAVADKSDPSNTECQRLVDSIAAYFASVDIESAALPSLLDALYAHLLNEKKLPPPYQDKPFVCALGALIYHEKL